MKFYRYAIGAVAACAVLALVQVAEARNPHCAGGIQYVSQGLNDKAKGNLEDYKREMLKAVDQLSQCSTEDPADLEALGYLGWAYAEVDSAGPAGKAFDAAITGMKAKNDKKLDVVVANRDHYWTLYFNDGVAKIQDAQKSWEDMGAEPKNDDEKALKAAAHRSYDAALLSLTRASQIKPNDPKTLRNVGSVYAFMGDPVTAETWFREGLKVAPEDPDLQKSVQLVRRNQAAMLIAKEKYDEAIAYYQELAKTAPNDADLQLGIADATFKRAQSKSGDAAKPDYKAAGDAYAKAASLKAGDADLTFNAGLSYNNAGEYALSEPQWRATIKVRPEDIDARSALGSSLAELKKYPEAVQVISEGLAKDPKNKTLHRQLGAVYSKAGNNGKATEELMVYLALQNGKPVSDVAATAKAAKGAAAAALTSAGAPEDIYVWEADKENYQSWFYWTKGVAQHYKAGALVSKSDWGSAAKAAAPTTKK